MSVHSSRYALAAMALVLAGGAQADTWKAVSGQFLADPAPPGPYTAVMDFVFGGEYFVDGEYSPQKNTRVLVGAGQENEPIPTFSASFFDLRHYPGIRPPQVDLANMRADFSSLFWFGWITSGPFAGDPAIGDVLGYGANGGWVPIVDNHNGTYGASWRVLPTWGYNGPGIFYITFAHVSAVPEASVPAYLLGGLAALAVVRRRRA